MRKRIPHHFVRAAVAFAVCNVQAHVRAESTEDPAKQLQNPAASLISVPVQNNFDFGGGYNAGNDVSYTFLQPFLSYTTRTSLSFTVNTESTYD